MHEIDFFVRDNDEITREQLKLKEETGMYPPRFKVIITCSETAKPTQARFQFRGTADDLVFDAYFSPLPNLILSSSK